MNPTVAFFCDHAMLPGLHGAIASLAEHLEDRGPEVRVVVFCDGISAREKRRLEDTHEPRARRSRLELRDFRPTRLADEANTLHGSTTNYGRLSLGDLLPDCDRCVYLDSDVLVCTDVREVLEQIEPGRTLAAYGRTARYTSIDAPMFRAAELDMDAPYFNSGVLGIDLVRWRERDVPGRCAQTARRYAGLARGADQPLLNVVCADDFALMPRRFNTDIYCDTDPVTIPTSCIVHFVGSPKPWDVFGRVVHRSFHRWHDTAARTDMDPRWPYRYGSFRRTVRTSRSAWIAGRKRALRAIRR